MLISEEGVDTHGMWIGDSVFISTERNGFQDIFRQKSAFILCC